MEEGAVLPLSVPCLIFQGLHSSSCVNTIEELRYCLMGEDCDLGEAQHGWAGARHSSTHSTPHPARSRSAYSASRVRSEDGTAGINFSVLQLLISSR